MIAFFSKFTTFNYSFYSFFLLGNYRYFSAIDSLAIWNNNSIKKAAISDIL